MPVASGPPPVWEAPESIRRGGALHEIAERARTVGRMQTPREAGWALLPLGQREAQEVGVVLALSVHCTYVAVREFARGDQEHVETPLYFAMREVQLAGSKYAVLAHNHPSGNCEPSPADLRLWQSARRQFACSGMTLLDHMVIGLDAFYSCAWDTTWRMK